MPAAHAPSPYRGAMPAVGDRSRRTVPKVTDSPAAQRRPNQRPFTTPPARRSDQPATPRTSPGRRSRRPEIPPVGSPPRLEVPPASLEGPDGTLRTPSRARGRRCSPGSRQRRSQDRPTSRAWCQQRHRTGLQHPRSLQARPDPGNRSPALDRRPFSRLQKPVPERVGRGILPLHLVLARTAATKCGTSPSDRCRKVRRTTATRILTVICGRR